jgi:hypothetical protein
MVAIGITGHRYLAEPDRLRSGLDEVARRLESAFPERWTVVSALAEGADRLVAQRLLARRGSGLVAVLPLPREDYARDFVTSDSRAEFEKLLARADEVTELPPRSDREEAYEAGGLAILDLSDVIVAVWDGQGTRGRGGTGGLVVSARERGMPVVWVHAGNRRASTREPTTLGPEQGQVTCERLPQD